MKPEFQFILEAIRRWAFVDLRINTKEHWADIENIITQLIEFEKSLADVS